MIIDLETIFWTIIVCAVLIIIFNWWLAYKREQHDLAQFMIIHEVSDKRTETFEEIQDDLKKIKEKLDIYH